VRVLRVLTRPNLGGPTRQAIALWHAQRALGVKTLLVTGAVDDAENALLPSAAGVPALDLRLALQEGPAAEGWVTVPTLGRGVAVIDDLRARATLRRLVLAKRPHVVHTHTSKAGWLGRSVAAKAGVPVVAHTFHGHVLADYFGRIPSAMLARLEARLARRTDLLFAVSRSCADELAAAGVAPRDRFHVVPPAVAVPEVLSRALARERLGIPAEQRRLACVGRLVPIKRVADFVALVAATDGWWGDVVGDGPERAALTAQANAIAAGRVTMRGVVPDLPALLPAYDALVIPSVREGWPLVAVEAFAAGVPVVGYDVPGVRDALADGRGVLVPPAAGPPGLAAAVTGLLAAPERVAACVAAARAAGPEFAPAAVAERLLREYRTVLASTGRTAPNRTS